MARAMWKGSLRISKLEIPVKLYAAVQEGGVHFRLLHTKDRVPVEQRMVDPEAGEEVPAKDVRRGLEIEPNVFVVLRREDTRAEADRSIEVQEFVPKSAVDIAWYERPYYVSPDRSAKDYAALCTVLREEERVGIARWTMRSRVYHGALTEVAGALALIALHPADEVVPLGELAAPGGPAISGAERKLGEQLIATLDAPFDPRTLRDEYRERVLEFVARKAKGKKLRVDEGPRPRAVTDLSRALERSLESAREKKVA